MTNDKTKQLQAVIEAGEDYEWYPTTERMIEVVACHLPDGTKSVMDIGAGDGRVLVAMDRKLRERRASEEAELYRERQPSVTPADVEKYRNDNLRRQALDNMYAIEKSTVLIQAQPDSVTLVGTDFYQQNLACLPVDYIFCNPPYSDFETWAAIIIESGFAKSAFLVIPRRWKESARIKAAIKKRGASTRVIHSDDFHDGERRARAVVDIVQVTFSADRYNRGPQDPFDIWFDQNVGTFDKADEEPDISEYERDRRELAKIRHLNTIGDMVDAYDEEYARMEANYRAIFALDYAILKELNVNKDGVRDGIKKKMAGLKAKYWQLLFERLDTITSRLCTKTKESFVRKIAGRQSIAFTANNAYAVVLWAIKNANQYVDQQLIDLFKDLSTFEGATNYKSNQKTWGRAAWRYNHWDWPDMERPNRYALDYRIVVTRCGAIPSPDKYGHISTYENPGNLAKSCHELIDDIIAVLGNLGFTFGTNHPSRDRHWSSGTWQNYYEKDEETILFQIKAYKNGNVHLRFKPEAIKALNVAAGRLLGWLRSADDVVSEMGYTPAEAAEYFGVVDRMRLGPSCLKLLHQAPAEPKPTPAPTPTPAKAEAGTPGDTVAAVAGLLNAEATQGNLF